MISITEQRNNDFIKRCIAIYNADVSAGRSITLDSIVTRAIYSRPACHYVNFDTASRKLYALRRKGETPSAQASLSAEMWAEIYNQVEVAMKGKKATQVSIAKALSFVLNFCRPSRFYISHEAGMRLIRPYVSFRIQRA